jgi:glycosyltransferase involved in cell wall biosynthesis
MSSSASRRPAVAFVFPGDSADPRASSGTPFNLTRAVEDIGVDVVRIAGRAPRFVERGLAASSFVRWRLGVAMGADAGSVGSGRAGIAPSRSRNAIALACVQLRRVDGVVQLMGSEYLIKPHAPIATLEDMTIKQAVDADYAGWRLPQRDLSWRMDRQRRGYQRATACCVMSNWAARSIRDDYGIDPVKLKVVGIGPNHPTRPVPRRWDVPRFLFVGKDWERKNGPLVVNAFRELREHVPSARLDVVGDHPQIDVPGVVTHGLLDISVPGDQVRLTALFNQATCFVLPSRHEPLGIVYVEAAAAGVPSIGTSVGGSREVIGAGGRIIDPKNPREIVAAMRELAEPSVAIEMGGRALEHSRRYTWRQVAERMLLALGINPPGIELEAEFLNDSTLVGGH